MSTSSLFTKEGFTALRASWILLALSVLAAIAIGAGGHWITERDKREGGQAEKRVRDARARLDAARRERDNLAESAEVFRALVERGILQDERRLDLVELVAELRRRHNLLTLEYDIAPQRPLPGSQFGSVDVLSSRVVLRARAVHEGDLLAFIEDLSRSPRGLYPVDKCAMKRIADDAPTTLRARVEAECSLEWITMREKKERRVRASRLFLLALCIALPAGASDLGTLFHTAEERARLDALRRGEPIAPPASSSAMPVPRSYAPEVTGFVKRSDGRNTVWIDGRAVPAPSNAKTAPLFDPRVVRDLEQEAPSTIKLIPSKKNPER